MRFCVALTLLCLAACGAPVEPPDAFIDAGRDAGRPDAGRSDAGTRDAGVDAGLRLDAGVRDAGPNHPPVVSASLNQSRTTAYAGQPVELSLGVTDEDGDLLTFTWTGPGFFFENGNPSAQRWVSEELSMPTQVTVSVSVTDGRSPAVIRSTTIDVTVPRFQDVFSNVLATPVLLGGQCIGCHGPMGEYQVSPIRSSAWAQLVDANHHHGSDCVAAGVPKMVVAGDRQRSLLYRKMTSTQPMGCGDGMPAMSQLVPASPRQHIVTVGSWIAAGALND
ncbi:MAG TPA: hypothetical protein VGE37_05860 [Archangium sp.]